MRAGRRRVRTGRPARGVPPLSHPTDRHRLRGACERAAFELVGCQLGRGERSSLCVDQYDFETGLASGCGSNVVRGGGAIDATSREQTAGHLPVAALVQVRDRELLRAIGVRTAFGRYLAEVPRGARGASAEALGARGRKLALAFFPGFRRPVGEGRPCYSQPRVARLRLLGPARVDEPGRLRIAASYPGGYIGSIDVNVGGRGGAHADLVQTSPRRAGGRRVVTLSVSFTRRGAVGVQVTATGIPLSRRCGARPLLRRSAPKTLVVRVR